VERGVDFYRGIELRNHVGYQKEKWNFPEGE